MSLFRPAIDRIEGYLPGEQPQETGWIKLNTNENPYGPSPRAVAAMQAELGDNLRLYPDPGAERLKNAIAKRFGLAKEQVFVGNGSDEVLAHAKLWAGDPNPLKRVAAARALSRPEYENPETFHTLTAFLDDSDPLVLENVSVAAME